MRNVEESMKQSSTWPERARFALQAKLTMAERRSLMDSFVKDGWLISTPGEVGPYSIGVRRHAVPGSLRVSARYAVVLRAILSKEGVAPLWLLNNLDL